MSWNIGALQFGGYDIGALQYYSSTTSSDSTWIASSDSSWSGASNWSLGTVPDATTRVFFTGDSTRSCTVDTDATIAYFNAVSAYTGNINWLKSKITCSGNWTFGANHTVTHVFDTVTITGDSTVTSNNKNFCFLKLNGSGKTLALGDNLVTRGYQKVAGTLNQNGKVFRVLGDQIQMTNLQSLS